ncbi:alanine--glyoxylate aminotransferase family protein [Tissierella sp. MB52-C2]|uniref:pyridoxal-phosphate-dependent aminotransferase family protein n=1 Tax=Tissierella sp. MB52-C2 TaxID=3070999 RepID=UPI00280B69F7|nr:alanine--glyoxylate aminotransferase family protein [Tissierella sp. MB52-C2]WMM24517.1 alanine--glyoxylate aminotransferase family protein [Tissierella sp. MB52-C2]
MKPRKLVMIPGPTPVVRSIQNQMGRETVAFGDPGFINDYKELLKDMKELWKTEGEVFVIAGTGTMAMEMGIANTLKSGDNLLIVSNGFFGDRFIDLAERKGINVDVISSEWGKIVPIEDIEAKLNEKKYDGITVTHVDTSTGVCAPIKEIGEMLKKFPETIYIVDGVCATAAEPEYVDDMNIDILITGSQKAFGVAPGLAIVWAGPKAMERRKELGRIPEYYIDFDKWLPIMNDPSKYFATPAINMIWALKESVRIIKEEGIENRYERHRKNARAMQAALEAIGFTLLAEKDHRAVTLSNVLYMDGVDDLEFRKILGEEGVVVAGGLAAYAGKMFRLGHMGNIDIHDMISTIAAIERALYRLGIEVELGKGVGVLMVELLK